MPSLSAPARPATHPPGPPSSWWGIPLLRAMWRDYLGFAARLHREHGDLTYMRLGRENAYDLFAPELVREALVDHADALLRWQRGIEVFEQVFGQSVLVTEGATWQRQRRMLQAAFTPRKVAGYAELMVGAAAHALDAAVPAGKAAVQVDMGALFSRLTMDVILRTLFSRPVDAAQADAAAAAVQALSATALREMFWPATLPDWLPLPGKARKRRALRLLRGLIAGHIEARQRLPAEARPVQDLLAMLLALRDEETGAALSAAEVFDQCMVSFQAGHETSAAALQWWSLLLARHPQAAARAHAEVDARLGTRAPTADDAQALPWLVATLKEAMRLYPPVAALMTRRTMRPIELGGHAIPAGALLRITPWVLHRDARWFSQPERFAPERFLPEAAPPPRGAYLPFGAGPRVCLGQHFALLEMTLAAALLLQRYEIEPDKATGPLRHQLGVTLRPQGRTPLTLWRR